MFWGLENIDSGAQITILADNYQGKRLNNPNDLVYKSDGSLYFTDPPYGLRTQTDSDPAKELQVNGVYRIPGAISQKPGAPPARAQLQLVIKDCRDPTGSSFHRMKNISTSITPSQRCFGCAIPCSAMGRSLTRSSSLTRARMRIMARQTE
jgi:hypothetical protein